MKNILLIFIFVFSFQSISFSQTEKSTDYRTYLRKVSKLTNERKHDEAIKLLTEAIDQKIPGESWLYLRRAEIYSRRKKLNLMENDIAKLIEFASEKNKLNLLHRAAMLMQFAKKCDKALKLINRAVNLDSSNYYSIYARAGIHLCSDNKVAALNDINLVLSLKPDNIQAKLFKRRLMSEIANNNVTSNDNDDLIISYENRLQQSPDDEKLKSVLADLYLNRARQFEREKKINEMFADYDKAVQLMPKAYHVYTLRGRKLYQYKFYERAISDFKKIIEKQPEHWITFMRLGDSYYKLGQYKKAIEEYKNGLKIEMASEKTLNERIKFVEQKLLKKTQEH